MPEGSPEQASKEPTYRDYGRIQPYAVIGVIIVLGFLAAAGLAYLNVPGPGLLTTDVAVWVLAICVAFVALGLLFLLFTLRSTLRTVRMQATEVAVLRSRMHTHQIIPATPPPIEYHAPSPPSPPARSVQLIEGIGPVLAQRLEHAGIATLRELRAARGSEVARAANVNHRVAVRWKVMADLLVLRSLGPQDAELLLYCGVGSIEELARQSTDSLLRRARRANRRHEARIVPEEFTRDRIAGWLAAARQHVGNHGVPSQRLAGATAAEPRPTT